MKILSATLFLSSVAFTYACSSDDSSGSPTGTTSTTSSSSTGSGGSTGAGGGGNCAGFDYSTYTPAGSPTLMNDVMPIFASAACGTAVACHGNNGFVPRLDGTMASAVSAAIVGVNAMEVPTLKYVAAGDPQNSYLMRKIESADPGCGLACTADPKDTSGKGCSTQMPNASPPLTAMQQATIRDWIKSGAN